MTRKVRGCWESHTAPGQAIAKKTQLLLCTYNCEPLLMNELIDQFLQEVKGASCGVHGESKSVKDQCDLQERTHDFLEIKERERCFGLIGSVVTNHFLSKSLATKRCTTPPLRFQRKAKSRPSFHPHHRQQ